MCSIYSNAYRKKIIIEARVYKIKILDPLLERKMMLRPNVNPKSLMFFNINKIRMQKPKTEMTGKEMNPQNAI